MLQDREKLLAALVAVGRGGAKAESLSEQELLSLTLPTPALRFADDPDLMLLVGGRGAGKTHLFRLLNLKREQVAESLQRYQPLTSFRSIPPQLPIRVTGFVLQKDASHFPTTSTLHSFASTRKRPELVYFWRGLMIAKLLHEGREGIGEALKVALSKSWPESRVSALIEATKGANILEVAHWYPLISTLESLGALDRALRYLDEKLTQEQCYLFITYDDLDRLALDWEQGRNLIQALFQFWLEQRRVLNYIRPKIFIRQDLWSQDFLSFPDASKFNAHRMNLTWTPRLLYQLTLKAWVNAKRQGDAARKFLEEKKIVFTHDESLGWMYNNYPEAPDETTLRDVMRTIVGPYMGRGPTKGRSYDWLPNHLQDAQGYLYPRSMLTLFSQAAQDERNNQRVDRSSVQLLSPASFRQALEQVSEQRLRELEEEYPWIGRLKQPFQGKMVPISQDDMEKLLADIHWDVGDLKRPPSQDPAQLVAYLLSIGILRRTHDRRLHVPDIYLYGFSLKRKGGIRKPKE